MATYRTTKCPYCGYVLEDRTPTAKELIGHPFATCPDCGNVYRTGKKYWRDFTTKQKVFYVVRQVFIGLYTALAFSMIPVLVIALLLKTGGGLWLYLLVFLMAFGVLSTLLPIRNIKLARLTENDANSSQTSSG